jgi:AraC-like DNA-binding protein
MMPCVLLVSSFFVVCKYVTQLRMERAKELLVDPDMSVKRVGELVGYPDVRHFAPSEWYGMMIARLLLGALFEL